ncbi:MAG: adenosylcobalamin-dependent ribonucleoside-diphosphate reductase [Caldilineaceae bacterium]|nr:adenosylcobalamin-dependent ribonucleoside-diphosphate reductase [Caldilineaceae bacterium]
MTVESKIPLDKATTALPRSYTTMEVVKGEKIHINPPNYVDDDAINLSDNAKKVLERRYLRRDIDGSLLESISGMFYRIASHVANVEKEQNGDVDGVTRTFYDLLTELRFFPNSPTFTGAGTPLGQLAACFVLAIEDDMGRESDGIFSTLRVAALIQQTGGGNGFSFSRLRPKGDVVHTSAGRATGPVGFLRVYDQAFGEIAQGGTRRGANMGVLRVDHPDIEDFIVCKAEEGTISNFNISVAITDEFMQAVKDDADFDLRSPRDGKVWKTVRARDLFGKIVKYAHHNGEPGALFIDAANRSNPVPHLYDLEATNPCGEQWLGPYENCCLGSINLGVHVMTDAGGNAVLDWEGLRRTIRESTHFLDNVVSANAYVPAVPEVAEAAYRARRIGLGIMGLGDLMYKLGIRYGSEEGQEFAAQIMEFVRFHSMQQSIDLAEERGTFLAFEGSIYDDRQPGGMKWQTPSPLFPYSRDWGRPSLDWNEIVAGIKAHGIRNAAQTTVAPTGTIATVSGCEGYGCEPVFALGYIRHFKDGDNDVELVYTSPLFEEALNRSDLSETHKQEIKQYVATYGSCQDLKDLPEHLRHTFVVSSDISAEEHVRMQAAIQAFVDNSISKCVVGDTLLLTADGLMPLQDLSPMRLPDQFEDLHRSIISPEGKEETNAFYYGGYRETRRVRMAYGFEIEGTPNHRVHVLTETGEVAFRELGDLRIGDTVVLYAGQEQYGLPAQVLPVYSGEFRSNSNRISFPIAMSEDLAFLLGCITSEGSIIRNGVSICNNDVALLESLKEIYARLFNLNGAIMADRRNQVHDLRVNSRALRNWLLVEMGLEAGAENKLIPNCILAASKREIAAFLRGLFLDAYMTQDGKLFGITLASERLICQLQILLLNMNIVATTRQTAERAWSLTVQGGELETLAQQISFVEVWKNERIEHRNLGRLQRFRNYSRLLPESVTNTLRTLQTSSDQSLRKLYSSDNADGKAYQRARVNLLQGHRLDRNDAQAIFNHLAQSDGESFAHHFFAQDQANKVYVDVQDISAGYAEVFDISVPGSHNFIANGMGNHNTCNFPEGATEEDVAQAYIMAWDLGCKGLTVYVTGSRQEVVLETKATKAKKTDGETATASAHQPAVNGFHEGQGHGKEDGQNGVYFTKRPRPRLLQGSTYRKDTPLGTAYITVNSDEHQEPFEVFLNIGKAGTDVSAVSEAIGRLISLTLRMPASLPPTERLRWVMDEMAGIGGGRALGFGVNRVRSLPDGIAQVFAEHLSGLPAGKESTVSGEQMALPLADRPIGDICPDCGEAAFLNVEGCRKCHVCGYSEC